MKRLNILLAALGILSIGLFSCKKDHASTSVSSSINIKTGSIVQLRTLKTLVQGLDSTAKLGNYKLTGTVISDPASGNFPSGYVVIQDSTGGITLSMDPAKAGTYIPGDSLIVNLNGAVLGNVLGTTLVGQLADTSISKPATGRTVAPVTLTLYQLAEGFVNYEGTLVHVMNTSITPMNPADLTFEGDQALSDISGPSTIRLHTSSTATFANVSLPQGATFTAIPMFYNSIGENTSNWATRELLIRNITELSPVETICAWQLTTPASAGTELTFPATTFADNTIQPSLSRGSAYVPTALARGFSSVANVLLTQKSDALTNNGYYQFSISAEQGHTVSITGLTSRLRRSSAGAAAYCWMYSLDGTNFKEIGSDYALTSTADGVDQPPIDLSTINDLQNVAGGTSVTFRLYGWGFGNVNSGTFAIGRWPAGVNTNSLTLSGIVQ